MAKISWIVHLDGEEFSGEAKHSFGSLRICPELPAGTLGKVEAQLEFPMKDDERAFFNGYQTWTHSPEYGKEDIQYGLSRMGRIAIRKYSLDRYGDYHFVDYPAKPGLFHGFSWCYLRDGERFRLIASLDEKCGYTIFEYDANDSVLRIIRDCEGVVFEGGRFSAFELFFAQGTEDEVFDGWFEAMDCHPRTQAKIKGYSSWYNRYEDIDEESILSDLAGCQTLFAPGDLFQIDDGWEPAIGDWLEPDPKKFPHGMREMADAAHDAGYLAGLWLAPFVCEKDSLIYKERPDWLLKVKGKPWRCGSNWSGFYSLDIDNPEVVDYLQLVFSQVIDLWGFDLVKLDFLYGAAPFSTSKESRAGRMIRALEMLRELCKDKLILGCGTPVMPAFGIVDYCRIGCDVSLDADDKWFMRHAHRERVSTRNAMDDMVYRRQLNGRAYGSDPDVFFLRSKNIKLSTKEREALAKCEALFGNVLLTSDDPATYDSEARSFYKELVGFSAARDVRVLDCKKHKWTVGYTLGDTHFQMKLKAP